MGGQMAQDRPIRACDIQSVISRSDKIQIADRREDGRLGMQYLVGKNERDRGGRFFEFDFGRYFSQFMIAHHSQMIACPSSERIFADGIDRVVQEGDAVYDGIVRCLIMFPGVSVECKQARVIRYIKYAVRRDR